MLRWLPQTTSWSDYRITDHDTDLQVSSVLIFCTYFLLFLHLKPHNRSTHIHTFPRIKSKEYIKYKKAMGKAKDAESIWYSNQNSYEQGKQMLTCLAFQIEKRQLSSFCLPDSFNFIFSKISLITSSETCHNSEWTYSTTPWYDLSCPKERPGISDVSPQSGTSGLPVWFHLYLLFCSSA